MKKIEYTKLEQESLKNLHKLMEHRISQLKEIYKHEWWEMSLADVSYNHLCQCYANIKSRHIYPTRKVSKKEKKLLIDKLVLKI